MNIIKIPEITQNILRNNWFDYTDIKNLCTPILKPFCKQIKRQSSVNKAKWQEREGKHIFDMRR